jgi:gamma-glutamylputrescine oxidase
MNNRSTTSNTNCKKENCSFPKQQPGIYEYYVNNAWYETSGFYEQETNAPLLEKKTKVDIAIIGGGFTGLASAYHLAKKFPAKRIIIIEGARCGYGASGRNGGHVIVYPFAQMMNIKERRGLEAARTMGQMSKHGYENIVSMVKNHGLDCDLRDSRHLSLCETEKNLESAKEIHKTLEMLDIDSSIIDRKEVNARIGTNHFHGALESECEKGVDPAKLVLGMKKIVESLNVEIYEQTRALKINPGKTINIETEFGEVEADSIVIATNAYSSMLGMFKRNVVSISDYVIATEPLNDQQMDSLGWKGREGLCDDRHLFNYYRISEDNRIVFGGEMPAYYYGNKIGLINNKKILTALEERLVTIWPQLEGVKIAHRWGGPCGISRDELPLVGVTGEHKNIYFGVGYTGEGVVWTQVAGEIISQLYAGEDTDLTRFFLVNRPMPYIPPEPFMKIGFETLMVYYGLKDKFNRNQ